MDPWEAVSRLLMLLATALLAGAICERLRLSALLGYLFAGALLGPHALAVVRDQQQVAVLAELGVALLLFSIGLEFSWRRLRATGRSALGGGVAQVVVTGALFAAAAAAAGVPGKAAVALGAIFALSSTASVLPALVRRAELDSVHGRHALGILLVQDIAVVPLVLLVETLKGGGGAGQALGQLGRALGFALGLVAALFVLANFAVPRLLGTETLRRNRELPILVAVVLGIGSAVVAHEFGLSPAIGAFLAGMMLAESPFATQIRADVGPLRTLLLTLFFSSIGMLADPAWIVAHPSQVAALVVALVVAKAAVVWLILRVFGLAHAPALATGLALGQAGEFAFVLGAAAAGTLLDGELFALVVSATIVSLFLTPFLVSYAARWSHALVSALAHAGLVRRRDAVPEPVAEPASPTVVVVGYGPSGRAVADQVSRSGRRPVVVDFNAASIAEVRSRGIEGHVGDATRADVLEHLHVGEASVLVVTIPDPAAARLVLQQVARCAPHLPVVVRARYHRHAAALRQAGARVVVDEEHEVGRALAAETARCIGT